MKNNFAKQQQQQHHHQQQHIRVDYLLSAELKVFLSFIKTFIFQCRRLEHLSSFEIVTILKNKNIFFIVLI